MYSEQIKILNMFRILNGEREERDRERERETSFNLFHFIFLNSYKLKLVNFKTVNYF